MSYMLLRWENFFFFWECVCVRVCGDVYAGVGRGGGDTGKGGKIPALFFFLSFF